MEPTPEETKVALINADIINGKLDDHLSSISDFIKMRRQKLAAQFGNSLSSGDTVTFNSKTRPKYLIGKQAEVIRVNKTTATVKPLEAAGRFSGEPIRCPLSLLDAA